jgi:hypothetical protein
MKDGEVGASEPRIDQAGIRHCHGTAEALPGEVAELGRPRSVHPPGAIAAIIREYRSVLLAASVIMVIAPFFLVPSVGLALLLVSLLGLVVGGVTFLLSRSPSIAFMVYRDVLVAVEGNSFTIVPWGEIVEFCIDTGFKTSEGRDYSLHGFPRVSQRSVLMHTLMDRVRDCRLVPAVAAVRNGQTLDFGPFAVNARAISHLGTVVRWEEITKMNLRGPGQRALIFNIRGALLPWTCSLEGVPNDFLLVDVIKQVCPEHLRVPTMPR